MRRESIAHCSLGRRVSTDRRREYPRSTEMSERTRPLCARERKFSNSPNQVRKFSSFVHQSKKSVGFESFRGRQLSYVRAGKLPSVPSNKRKRGASSTNWGDKKRICPHAGLNYGPPVYKTGALPLSYKGFETGNEISNQVLDQSAVLT